MGLLNQTQSTYYGSGNSANYGDYQFVSLDHIINGFMVSYVGESKLIPKVSRTDVQFHGMRAIQEFSYDIFRSVKSQEIEVPNTLKMILPQDYVNYCKIVRVDSNGIEKPIYPTGKTSNPFAINQITDPISSSQSVGDYNFDHDGDGVTYDEGTGEPVPGEDQLGYADESDTWKRFSSLPTSNSNQDYDALDAQRFDNRGRRYGLDPQHAQQNGTFFIDYARGFIHFSSDLAGETITLKYISDGLGTDSEMVVHKFCEEAVYKWIAYGIISSRSNMPEYIVQRFKKERFAEARKAKIRLSNIKIEEFTQVLKGLGKTLK